MTREYLGTFEGRPFVAVNTQDPVEQSRLGVAVDILTDLPGSNPAAFTDKGWTARPLAEGVTLDEAEVVLTKGHEEEIIVEHRGEVSASDLLGVLPRKQFKRFFGVVAPAGF